MITPEILRPLQSLMTWMRVHEIVTARIADGYTYSQRDASGEEKVCNLPSAADNMRSFWRLSQKTIRESTLRNLRLHYSEYDHWDHCFLDSLEIKLLESRSLATFRIWFQSSKSTACGHDHEQVLSTEGHFVWILDNHQWAYRIEATTREDVYTPA